MNRDRTLSWDWHPGVVPENVVVDETAYIETTYSFGRFRSQLPVGLQFERGSSCYKSTMFDVGPRGHVKLGQYALVHGARIICETEILIGDYALISWNVVLMDAYRSALTVTERRQQLESISVRESHSSDTCHNEFAAKPIHIDRNVWIGFDACVLPGVTIGEGAVVGARSVVFENVPPFTVVAGNPARVIRQLNPQEKSST